MSEESPALYDVLTWDGSAELFTEQEGMTAPCLGVTLPGLLSALRELRRDFAYSCHRIRLANGSYVSDPAVLVERVEDRDRFNQPRLFS